MTAGELHLRHTKKLITPSWLLNFLFTLSFKTKKDKYERAMQKPDGSDIRPQRISFLVLCNIFTVVTGVTIRLFFHLTAGWVKPWKQPFPVLTERKSNNMVNNGLLRVKREHTAYIVVVYNSLTAMSQNQSQSWQLSSTMKEVEAFTAKRSDLRVWRLFHHQVMVTLS